MQRGPRNIEYAKRKSVEDYREIYANKKYNDVLVVDFVSKREVYNSDGKTTTRILAICRCDCGKEFETRVENIVGEKTKSCGCRKVRSPEDRWKVSAKQRFNSYSDGDLTFDQFVELSQKNCHYCNCPPSNVAQMTSKRLDESIKHDYRWIHNGLDRIDSSRGHFLDNVVPCCKSCNSMKMAKTVEEFYRHVANVYEYSYRRSRSTPEKFEWIQSLFKDI